MGSPWDTPYIPGRPNANPGNQVASIQSAPAPATPSQYQPQAEPQTIRLAPEPLQQVANPFTTSAPAQLPAYSPGPSPVRQQQPQAPVRQQQPQAPVHHPQQEQPRTVAYLDDVRATAAVRYEEPTVAPINKFAIAALISAFFVPIIAVIFGHLALRDINGGKGEGRRMAVASLILGYFGIVWVTALAITFAAGILVVGAGGKIIIG